MAPPTTSPRYLLYCRAFAAAAAVHLLLPDALQDGWIVPDAIFWLGALVLALSGSIVGWMLAVVGALWPLVALDDHLSQSPYMVLCAASAVLCWVGPAAMRERRMAAALPLAVRSLTVLTYALSVLHKLNRGFLDPSVSCASGGIEILARNWGIPALANPSLASTWPLLYLSVEAVVVALLCLRPAAGIGLALLMHIPLTIIFAPAFAFVMMSGYVMLLTEPDIEHLARTLWARGAAIVGIGSALGVGSFLLYLRHHSVVYWFWSFKELLLWVAVVWMAVAWGRRTPQVFRPGGGWLEPGPRPRPRARILAIVVALAVANGLTPYLGLQFHHAGAMLSNLRIDHGCWNSLVFPEGLRLADPYLRIDRARVGAGRPDLEPHLIETLWSRDSLRRFRISSCRHLARPVAIEGRFRDRHFAVADLCGPAGARLVAGTLPGFAAFQDDLTRACPEYCIH